MCCSAWPARFSRTITGTWEVLVDGKVNHVLWYQNKVGDGGANLSVRADVIRNAMGSPDWTNECADRMQMYNITVSSIIREIEEHTRKPYPFPIPDEVVIGQGNCLIIPLLGTWESITLLDTLKTPKLLDDVSNAVQLPPSRGLIQEKGMSAIFGSTGAIVFLQFDIYDIVLAQRASDIPQVLPQIQKSKRPRVNADVFETMDRWYGCPVAVCCFNSVDSGTAKPLGFAFEPLYPDKLVVYTLDGHDGLPPNPTAKVKLDHDIFVGSYLMKSEQHAHVEYQDFIFPSLKKYLLEDVLGAPCAEKMENGDFIFSTEAVRAGHFEGLRSLPPFGPHELPRLGQTLTRSQPYQSLGRPRRNL